jgi:hypothetical protein
MMMNIIGLAFDDPRGTMGIELSTMIFEGRIQDEYDLGVPVPTLAAPV